MRASDQVQLPDTAVPLPANDIRTVFEAPADRGVHVRNTQFETSGILQGPVSVMRDLNYVYAGAQAPTDQLSGATHSWKSADSRQLGDVTVQMRDIDQSTRAIPAFRSDQPLRTIVVNSSLDLSRVPKVGKPYVLPALLLHFVRASTADGARQADQIQVETKPRDEKTKGLDNEAVLGLARGSGYNDIDRFVSRFDLYGEDKHALVHDIVEGAFAMDLKKYARQIVDTTELHKQGDTRERDYVMSDAHYEKAVKEVADSILTVYTAHLERELYLEARSIQSDPRAVIESPNLYFDGLGRLQTGNAAYSRKEIAAALGSVPLGRLLAGGVPTNDIAVSNPDELRKYEVVVVPAARIDAAGILANRIRAKGFPLIAKPDEGYGGSFARTLAGDGIVQRITPNIGDLQRVRVADFRPPSTWHKFRDSEFGKFVHSSSKLALGVLPFAWFASAVADDSTDYVPRVGVIAAALLIASWPNRQPLVRTMGDPRVGRQASTGQSGQETYKTSEPFYAEQSSVERERSQADSDGNPLTNSALDTGRDADSDGIPG